MGILIEQYKTQLAKLRRMQFDQSSEKSDAQIVQLEMMLEDLEEGEAARVASQAANADQTKRPERERRQPVRKPLPDHLPREEIVHAAGEVCPGCGGTHFSKLGDDVTEVLEKIPARLKVIRHIRPSCLAGLARRLSRHHRRICRSRRAVPVPALSPMSWSPNISTGCRCQGIEIERATLCDWVGHVAWWMAPTTSS